MKFENDNKDMIQGHVHYAIDLYLSELHAGLQIARSKIMKSISDQYFDSQKL